MHSSNLLLTSVRNRLMNTAMTENFVISFVISRYVEPEVYMGAQLPSCTHGTQVRTESIKAKKGNKLSYFKLHSSYKFTPFYSSCFFIFFLHFFNNFFFRFRFPEERTRDDRSPLSRARNSDTRPVFRHILTL